MTNSSSGPLQRIADLEAFTASLEARIASLESGGQSAKKARAPQRTSRRVRPLSERNRDLAIMAWEIEKEAIANSQRTEITQTEWHEAIKKLDQDGTFPSHCGFLGETLRALLAERAGLMIRWGSQTLWGSGEPESARYRGQDDGADQ